MKQVRTMYVKVRNITDTRRLLVFAVTVVTVLVSHASGDSVCSDSVKRAQLAADPDDCAGFFICHSGHTFRFSCESKLGPRKVFDPKSGNCVLKGSVHDNSKCKYTCSSVDAWN